MLRDADLAGANLLGANLRGAVLARASLRGANLEGADLSLADVSETDLRWVKMNDRTAMPEGWEDVVAHGPGLRATLPSTMPDRVSAEEWLRAEEDQQECQMIT